MLFTELDEEADLEAGVWEIASAGAITREGVAEGDSATVKKVLLKC